ncbi:MAG: AAA family ATPase [Sedimentitalea sp.]|uniref:AAA family ATPase n=2 Tax=Sedimentitalea sp. TaxID=2048915 RepID=UPI00326711B5
MPFLTDRIDQTQREQRLTSALGYENAGRTDRMPADTSFNPRLRSRFSFDPKQIENELRTSIIGQEEPIEKVMEILKVVRADIGDPRKPLASIMLCGPTGVGKTETVRTIARAMYGDADAFCRVDMNTLSQEHYAAAITGAPPGYVGSKEGTTILDQETIEGQRDLPGLVLFDELEKASNEVVLALMNVFDNGILTVASGGRTYSFRNSLIFMSSNLGATELMSLGDSKPALGTLWKNLRSKPATPRQDARDIVMKELLARFPPELVNRFDHIETFNPISKDQLPDLVDVELARLNNRLKKHELRLQISEDVRSFISTEGYDKRFGARDLRRAMRRLLEFPLADYLLSNQGGHAPSDGCVNMDIVAEHLDGAISFRSSERADHT